MNGRNGLHMALLSHGPIDLLALMLGTNDCKTRFAPTPERVTAGIAGLLDIALSPDIQARHGGFDILLICPPSVEETGVLAGEFWGATAVSRELAAHYTALADARRYDTPFGNAEALSMDEQGAWVGVDNNAQTRRDGEKRPIVWRFAAPKGGWGARQ